MKRVEWDEPRFRGPVFEINGFLSAFSDQVEPGMVVSARYKGGGVYLEVLEEFSPMKFSAEVCGFEFPAQTFLDLGIGDEVEIPREKINWIHFR
jgi:hypothetical protein